MSVTASLGTFTEAVADGAPAVDRKTTGQYGDGLGSEEEERQLDGGLIVKGYRHAADRPDIQVSDYGHDGLQSIFVNRRFWNEDRCEELIKEDEVEDT